MIATVSGLRQLAGKKNEVSVWKDGGQSAASVQREEWGEESSRGHSELGQPKQLQTWVCGGKIVDGELIENTSEKLIGRAAVDPSRWAVQYGETVRRRAAVPMVKLAVKHLWLSLRSNTYIAVKHL